MAKEVKEVKNNVVWKIDTLGERGSTPYSAAIINDSLFIVVGTFVRMDSLNQYGSGAYNIAIGDGHSWKYCAVGLLVPGASDWSVVPLTDVHVISEDNIIVCSYASVHQWNGKEWKILASFIKTHPFSKQIYCMAVTADGSIYCGGRSGTLFCIKNGTWTDISLPTTKEILNIEVSPSRSGKSNTVVGVLTNMTRASDSTSILEISSNDVVKYDVTGIPVAMGALWTYDDSYYIGGIGVYSSTNIQGKWNQITAPATYITNITGTWKNDIFIGGYNLLMHFNGQQWSPINDHRIEMISHLACTERTLLAVGLVGNNALVSIGNRY